MAERFFTQVKANHFVLEYDTAWVGDFRPFRPVPGHKSVVVGIVTSKTSVLERVDALKRRM